MLVERHHGTIVKLEFGPIELTSYVFGNIVLGQRPAYVLANVLECFPNYSCQIFDRVEM